MRSFFSLAAILCSIFFADAQCSDIGVYYWGGQLSGIDTSAIIPTAKGLADGLGVHTIRITLASNGDAVYKNGGPCLTGMNLKSLASRADFQSIISDPQFSTVIITAYDWSSFGDCSTQNFLDTNFYTVANVSAIEQEYTDLANYLKTFTSKKFIISNWEGDNACYCGAAYYYPNCAAAPANLAGFKKWMDARAAGINAAGASNVKVGIEFCNIHSLENLGKPSVLNNIIPDVYADYYLYSSYESINISANQFRNDIGFIRNKLASFGKDSSTLVIGEMGFGADDWGSAQRAADSLQNMLNVVNQKNLPYAIAWVLIDSPSNFGMFDNNQALTPNGTALMNNLCQSSAMLKNDLGPSFSLLPDPNDGTFTIIAEQDRSYSLEITNAIGKVCYLASMSGGKRIELHDLAAGVYYVHLSDPFTSCVQRMVVVHQAF